MSPRLPITRARCQPQFGSRKLWEFTAGAASDALAASKLQPVTAGSIAPMPVIRSWLSDESIPASRINRKARHCGRTARIQPVQRVERRALGGMPEGFVVCGGDKGLGKKKGHRICSSGPSGVSERWGEGCAHSPGRSAPSVNRYSFQPNTLGTQALVEHMRG